LISAAPLVPLSFPQVYAATWGSLCGLGSVLTYLRFLR